MVAVEHGSDWNCREKLGVKFPKHEFIDGDETCMVVVENGDEVQRLKME